MYKSVSFFPGEIFLATISRDTLSTCFNSLSMTLTELKRNGIKSTRSFVLSISNQNRYLSTLPNLIIQAYNLTNNTLSLVIAINSRKTKYLVPPT